MRTLVAFVLAAHLGLNLAPNFAWAAGKTFDVHLIDVEGGKAVLMVTPGGESILIDVGWAAGGPREASTDRVADAVRAAGLRQIDYLVISHYDVDHLGDVPQLAARVPIRHLVDHGPYTGTNAGTQQRYAAYSRLYETIPHIEVKPGERLPVKGLDIEVVTAAGNVIDRPVKGGGAANPFCAANARKAELPSDKEDNNSVGLLFTYGKFRMLDLADLEAYKEYELACPANLIGTVDVYQVNVHGQFKGIAPELVSALHARVAMMGNGARKGGDPPTWPVLRGAPGLEDIWQLHYSVAGGKDNNPPDDFIANLEPSTPAPNDRWNTLKLVALSNGTFTVTNERNGFSKTYQPRR
jgi:beta-lactamase superfamily II metal-dependent hydrolase